MYKEPQRSTRRQQNNQQLNNHTIRLEHSPQGRTANERPREQSVIARKQRAQHQAAKERQMRQAPERNSLERESLMRERVRPRSQEMPRHETPIERNYPEYEPRKKRRGCGCLPWLLFIVLTLVAAFAGLWFFRVYTAPVPITDIATSEREQIALDRERRNVYILFAGTDERGDEPSRSDTIIYTAFRPADRKIEMVSIPRDTLVNIPGEGEDKINAALAYGGLDMMDRTVEGFVDNRVDHTVLLNFKSFPKIIDAMGGITIDVPEKMYLPEEGIDLEAGKQKLKGKDALAFVRWRGDGQGDLGRIERQKVFMDAVMQKMRHLTPWRAAATAWVLAKEIDSNLSTFDILKLGWNFIGIQKDGLEFQKFDVEPTYINGVSYVLIDEGNVNEVVQKMKYGTVLYK